MFNFNPYYNYYSNPAPRYYSYYSNPAFFSHYRPFNNMNNRLRTTIYNFSNKPNNTYNEDTAENEIKDNDKIDINCDNCEDTKNNENEKKETVRFSIGDFSLTDRGINLFGFHLDFDDIIIILLIIFLFFETDCDMSLIIILGLMLFNINLSTIKNIF